MNKDKLKNPYFWASVFSAMLLALNLEFSDFTSWGYLWEVLKTVGASPFKIGLLVVTFMGIYNNNTTSGLDKLGGK